MPDKAKPKAEGASRASKPKAASTTRRSAKAPAKAAKAPRAASAGAARPAEAPSPPEGDWRAAMLSEVRRLIRQADPDIVEEAKWVKPTNPAGVPTWSHDGIVCTGETYQKAVKLTFARGAVLPDPQGLFNASLEGNTRRAIDLHEGDKLDAKAFKALVQAAVAENVRASASKSGSRGKAGAKAAPRAGSGKEAPPPGGGGGPMLLKGGNPQIPKGDGDAPVQAYIAAMPGWKRGLGERLDALIVRTVPDVRKGVRWNSPFYGAEGRGWFLSVHVFTNFVKVTFFDGTSLRPIPPGGTPKSKETRWIDIREGEYDEAQMASWVKQAAALPGWEF